MKWDLIQFISIFIFFMARYNNSFIVLKLKMDVGEGGSKEKVTFGKHNKVKYFQKEHYFPARLLVMDIKWQILILQKCEIRWDALTWIPQENVSVVEQKVVEQKVNFRTFRPGTELISRKLPFLSIPKGQEY